MRVTTAGLFSLLTVAALGSCSTTVRAYQVDNQRPQHNGIPFFLPKPVLVVKKPLEQRRLEKLFALLEFSGVHHALYPLDVENLGATIPKLRRLLQHPRGNFVFEPADGSPTALQELHFSLGKDKPGAFLKTHLLKAPTQISHESKPFYTIEDKQAWEVLYVPDRKREYELVIEPSHFASVDVDVTLSDGWQLSQLGANTGENQLVKEIGALAQTVIGAGKEIEVARIGKEQALALEKLKQLGSTGPEPTEAGGQDVKQVAIRLLGYVRRADVEVVQPGIYDLDGIVAGTPLATKTVVLWTAVKL